MKMRTHATKLAQRCLVVATAITIAMIPVRGRAGSSDAHKGELQAKIEYCTYCHGSAGRGYRGFYTMPRLAGQTPEYIENQLRAFVELRRDRGIPIRMSRVHAVKPGMRTALAEHFSKLNPKTFDHGSGGHSGAGEKIYAEGVPESNVPACVACHGPQGLGTGPTPRLAGQLSSYTQKQLLTWSKSRGQDPSTVDTSAVMRPIAASLSKSQVEAISNYLNSLK